MMNCEEVRTQLESRSALNARGGAIDAHLKQCPECAAYAREMAGDDEIFATALTQLPDEKSWKKARLGLSARLNEIDAEEARERIPKASRRTPIRKPQRTASGQWWIAVAASAAVLALVFVLSGKKTPAPNETQIVETEKKEPETPEPSPSPRETIAQTPVEPNSIFEPQPAPTPIPQKPEIAVELRKPEPKPEPQVINPPASAVAVENPKSVPDKEKPPEKVAQAAPEKTATVPEKVAVTEEPKSSPGDKTSKPDTVASTNTVPPQPTKAAKPPVVMGKIDKLNSMKVLLTHAGKTDSAEAAAGETFSDGDSLKVVASGPAQPSVNTPAAAEIMLKDGSTFAVKPDTEITLKDENGAVRILVDAGELTANVRPQPQNKALIVRTQQGPEVGVMAAAFNVVADVQGKNLVVRVDQGQVFVKNMNLIQVVNADQMLKVADGAAPGQPLATKPPATSKPGSGSRPGTPSTGGAKTSTNPPRMSR